MDNKDLFAGLSKEEMDRYTEEAKEKWGDTDAFKQSVERVKKMGTFGLIKAAREANAITKGLAKLMKDGKGASDPEVQALIQRHYDSLRAFYEPNLEMYKGLAEMYVSDARFKDTYEKIAPGLAGFMSKAMLYFIEQKKK